MFSELGIARGIKMIDFVLILGGFRLKACVSEGSGFRVGRL